MPMSFYKRNPSYAKKIFLLHEHFLCLKKNSLHDFDLVCGQDKNIMRIETCKLSASFNLPLWRKFIYQQQCIHRHSVST